MSHSRVRLAIALSAAVLGAAAPAVASAHGDSAFEHRFAQGDPSTGAMFRWWWPGAAVDDAEVRREVDAMADAGYKGVEIADVFPSVEYPVDPDKYGYGTERWNHAVKVVLRAATQRGLQVDLTLGAHWPSGVPGLNVDGLASSKELVTAQSIVRDGGTFSGPVPAPPAKNYEDRTSTNGVISSQTKTAKTTYVSVAAVRCVDDCSAQPEQLDLDSETDLSARVGSDGKLTWTPPDDGAWLVVGYWSRGTAQRNDAPFGFFPYLTTDPESRVVDHFGDKGAQAMIAFMNSLFDAETRQLLRRNGGSIFEDSLELIHSQAWTPEFLKAFEQRRGYSLIGYLPVLAHEEQSLPFAPPAALYAFGGDDATVAERVTRDVRQTLNDLYLDNHVDPLKRWANSLGLSYRAQPYGEPVDLAQAAGRVDVPESESLACGLCEDWRALTAGADLTGRGVVSDELLVGGFTGSYKSTRRQVVEQGNAEFAAGANQAVLHGFPYANWPQSADGTISDDAARWPGFHGFPAFIPEAFGPREPEWTMASDSAGYFARTQLLLQQGRRRTDVAVYNQALDHLGDTGISDTGLAAAGYSYGYVTPGSLAPPSAWVAGRRLAPAGPAYKALVIDRAVSMPIASAQKILAFARAGLPVVVVGDPPARTPGYAANPAAADAQLRAVIARLLAEPSVLRVATPAGVPGALKSAGIGPDASAADSAIRTTHRADGDADYYYVFNSSAQRVATTVSLSGSGIPVRLDPWTGDSAPVGRYTAKGGRTTLDLALQPSEAALIEIRRGRDEQHVVAGNADVVDDALRVTAPGSYTTTLSNGRVVRRTAAGVPAPVALAAWDLVVDDWLPGLAGQPSSVTRHATWSFDAIALTPWSAITQITDASGVGRYTTTVRVPHGLDGAYLDLGTVNGSYRVRVNGRAVGPVNQLSERVDLGRSLRPGTNTIEVVVATNLNNRLRVHRPAEYGGQPKQDYGLLGPVMLRPYVDLKL